MSPSTLNTSLMKATSLLIVLILATFSVRGQDDLMDILNANTDDNGGVVTATFKSTRLINGHSIETRPQGVLEFVIGHRFGPINSGGEFLWGLDGAQIRLGLEYGVTDRLNVGIGRSSFDAVFDFFGKYKLLRQSSTMPVSSTLFVSMARNTNQNFDEVIGAGFVGEHRNAYTYQLLIARKIDSRLSLQVMPTLVHRNYVETRAEPNDLVAIGVGGRFKITNRVTINAEYYPTVNQADDTRFQDAVAIGVDIETGGHVFQLHLTNAQEINERGFIGQTTGDFLDGGIHFGFNISRVFNIAVKE